MSFFSPQSLTKESDTGKAYGAMIFDFCRTDEQPEKPQIREESLPAEALRRGDNGIVFIVYVL